MIPCSQCCHYVDGRCRRYAPRPQLITTRDYVQAAGNLPTVVWPRTAATDTCGEARPGGQAGGAG